MIQEFLNLGNDEQRDFLDDRLKNEECEKLIRTLLQIVAKISSEPLLVKWALAMINGIIEDNRSRIKFLAQIQKSYNREKKLDCIRILVSFLNQ